MPERVLNSLRTAISARVSRVGEFVRAVSSTTSFSWFAIVLLALAITSLTTISFQQIPSQVHVGQIAARDIKADRNYEIVDKEATQKIRDEAMASVLPVYDFDLGLAEAQAIKLREVFKDVRNLTASWDMAERQLSLERQDELGRIIEQKLGTGFPSAHVSRLAKDNFSRRSEEVVISLVTRAMSQPLMPEIGKQESSESPAAVMRTSGELEEAGVPEEREVDDIGAFQDVAKERALLERLDLSSMGISDKALREAVLALAVMTVQPNVVFNRTETLTRREAAASGAKDSVIKIKAGEMIVREGARYDQWHIKVLAGMKEERKGASYYLEFIGTFILVLCFLVLPFMAVEKFFRRGRVSREDHALMAAVGLSVLLLMRVSLTLAPAIRDAFLLTMDASVLHYAVPVAGGAMLIRMFLRADVSFVFALVLSLFAGLFVETETTFVAYSMITSLTAIMAIANADRRSHIIRAGAVVGAAAVVAALGTRLIIVANSPAANAFSETLWCMLFALLSGLGCAIYSMIAAPIVESVSGYTSDIKLLELANLNHPLLRELVVRAPGTYHHSHLVGLLAEAAATEVGANSLLVRVGAYYHDIGKLKKPQYFIENTKPGENRHEKLSPHMSALIVAAHVKDGVELAGESKIPRVIYDMIPQHHGTRLISFFYDKAKASEDPTMQKVDPKDFRYPGPKPQTREAAILMLADVVEASVRALKEKSPTRIEQTVKKTIHDIFSETQLDECDLTLRDLDLIGTAFARTLLGIYHARIEYAKEVENEREKQSQHKQAGGDQGESPKRAQDDEAPVDGGSQGN
ncbi:MAG: HDIG domain-containing metalloprotein [bacterium]